MGKTTGNLRELNNSFYCKDKEQQCNVLCMLSEQKLSFNPKSAFSLRKSISFPPDGIALLFFSADDVDVTWI